MDFSSEPVVVVNEAIICQEDQVVLDNIKFNIEKGEFVYLIGRTGSGKSSLLKTLYADLTLQSGEVIVSGVNIMGIKQKQVPYLRRKIGIVFQDFQLFNDRTVTENLNFVMKATGWKEKSKMKTRLAEVLMRVGLGAVASKMPHQLSGGEQQRVVIARALLNEPSILIADEPTGNLDPQVADDIFKLFLEINRNGTAVLMATHNHTLLTNYPARVLKCENAKILDSEIEEFELTGYY
ncbi:MAG: cell division transport system ATP-binding protein [Cyclobacteriaceae bacterium]|jgi:cell division transport system ATP-binding protein